MAEGLGLWLRRAREARKLTLDEVEQALRIRSRYLQALEVGDFSALPGEIQARGFLRNYARFLGLPVEEAMARYEAEVQGRPMQPRPRSTAGDTQDAILKRPAVFPPPPGEGEMEVAAARPVAANRLLPILLASMAVFLVIAVGGFIYLQFFSKPAVATPATPPNGLAATSVAVTMPLSSTAFRPSADGTVVVRLEPQEHAWVRIAADANVAFEGIATPGQALQFAARESLTVATGNGGAFHLYVNNDDWGALGAEGQVVRRGWSPTGELALQSP